MLRPGGLLIASSPDRDYYSAPGVQSNPFHKRELNRDEFVGLLSEQFDFVVTALQRPMVGSVLMPELPGASAVPTVFERRDTDLVRGCVGLPHAVYVVCFASNIPVSVSPTLYIDSSDLDGPSARLANAIEAAQSATAEAAALRSAYTAVEAERTSAVEAAETGQRHAQESARLAQLQSAELDHLTAIVSDSGPQQRAAPDRPECVSVGPAEAGEQEEAAPAQLGAPSIISLGAQTQHGWTDDERPIAQPEAVVIPARRTHLGENVREPDERPVSAEMSFTFYRRNANLSNAP